MSAPGSSLCAVIAGVGSATIGPRHSQLKAVLVMVSFLFSPCEAAATASTSGSCSSSSSSGGVLDVEALTHFVGDRPVLGAVAGTSFGWFMTALGAATVVLVKHPLLDRSLQQVLDLMLGVAAGVMIAASYFSLLRPALDMAVEDGYKGLSFLPVTAGFLTGGMLLRLSDALLTRYGARLEGLDLYKAALSAPETSTRRTRAGAPPALQAAGGLTPQAEAKNRAAAHMRVKRMLQLVIAITAHNAPEGLAVGVAFGALSGAGRTTSATSLAGAVSLALGIGIQVHPRALDAKACMALSTPGVLPPAEFSRGPRRVPPALPRGRLVRDRVPVRANVGRC